MVYQVLSGEDSLGQLQLLSPRRRTNQLVDRLTTDNIRQPQPSLSPRQDHQNQSRKVAYRRPDSGTEEFMRFVRNYQYERQPTNIRLQKRVPLPGIGESNRTGLTSTFEHPNSPYDDTYVDSDVTFVNNKQDPRQDPMLQEVLTLARERTKDHIILSSWNGQMQNGNLVFESNRNNVVPPRHSNEPYKTPKTLHGVKPNTKNLSKQLPPLSYEDIPIRPCAPSPSLTLPYLNCSEDSFVTEEPVEDTDL